jgi:hypothetical protein
MSAKLVNAHFVCCVSPIRLMADGDRLIDIGKALQYKFLMTCSTSARLFVSLRNVLVAQNICTNAYWSTPGSTREGLTYPILPTEMPSALKETSRQVGLSWWKIITLPVRQSAIRIHRLTDSSRCVMPFQKAGKTGYNRATRQQPYKRLTALQSLPARIFRTAENK